MGAKSDACFRLNGFGFAHASAAFRDENRSVARGWRWDYGEDANWEHGQALPDRRGQRTAPNPRQGP